MKETFVNLTPETIVLADGSVFFPSGTVAYTEPGKFPHVGMICEDPEEKGAKNEWPQSHPSIPLFDGADTIIDLPDPVPNTHYIVSRAVAQAAVDRSDLVVPAEEHPDCVRDNRGVISVPGFMIYSYQAFCLKFNCVENALAYQAKAKPTTA